MKKFTALLISIFYLLSANMTFAACSNLYFVKNADKSYVKTLVEPQIDTTKYYLQKKDPYFAYTKSKTNDFVVVILQQTGANMFYYFKSSGNNALDRAILKALKDGGLTYEKSLNEKYISLYEVQAQKVLMGNNISYDFSEPKPATPQYTSTTANKVQNNTLKGYVGKIDKGTTFKAYLQTPLNTATASVGDSVTAILSEDWVFNGSVVAPQGSVVSGKVKKARHATIGTVNGRVVIDFNNLTSTEGKVYNISTEAVDFTVTNEGKLGRTAKTVATGAIIGIVGGLLYALLSDGDTSYGKAVAVGAATGAVGGAVKEGIEAGVDAEIPVYTELDLTLTKPMNVTFQY